MSSAKTRLLGLDGGASKVRGSEISPTTRGFEFEGVPVENEYRNHPDHFKDYSPVDIDQQLSEKKSGKINLRKDEIKYGHVITDTIVKTIVDLVGQKSGPWIIGLGFPGLKTENNRGIAAMVNGPRLPHLTSDIEIKLKYEQIDLLNPIHQLGSDADYCGLGEEHGTGGLFKNIDNAYYIGGGTGVADALKLHGKLVPLNNTQDWLRKSWEMKIGGFSFESILSVRGIQEQYSLKAGVHIHELSEKGIYAQQILQQAQNNNQQAIDTLCETGKTLGILLFERIETIACGWQNRFEFINVKRHHLFPDHSYLGTILERGIIGQRLGSLLQLDLDSRIIWEELENTLSLMIGKTENLPEPFKLNFKPKNFIRISSLRNAPVLGAAVDAWNTFLKDTDA